MTGRSPERGAPRRASSMLLAVLVALCLAACTDGGSSDPLTPQGGTTSASDTSNELVAISFLDRRTGFGIAEPQTGSGLALPLRVERTSDGGSSWHVVGLLPESPAVTSTVRLLFTTPGTGFFRLGGELFSTFDGGRHWTRVSLAGRALGVAGTASRIWAAYSTCPSLPAGVVVAHPCSAGVEVSVDGGHSWQIQPGIAAAAYEAGELSTTAAAAYLGLWRATSGATPGGTLFSTTDGGASWVGQPLPCPSGYQLGGSISAVPASPVLWLACLGQASGGTQGKVLFRSGDGGATWSAGSGRTVGPPTGVPEGAPSSSLEGLQGVSSTQALVLTVNDGLMRTTDGGATFQTAVGTIAGYESTLAFADRQHGWVAAYVTTANPGAGLWRTADAGATWSVVARH